MNLPPERSRTTRACDFCHRRGRKCRPLDSRSNRCSTCTNHGVECTWNRVIAKRGVKPRVDGKVLSVWTLNSHRHGSRAWVTALINVFFTDIYPIVCTVNEFSFKAEWEAGALPSDPASYARLIAICALSARRIASGASSVPSHIDEVHSPQVYMEDGVAALSTELQDLRAIEWLQSAHLLAVTAMESGNASLYHQLMGLCHSMIADQGLAEESRWPSDLTLHDREEWRRLIWHLYRLEVHTALVLGHAVRFPELQIAVEYPENSTFDVNSQDNFDVEWLPGWNFVTDLYRALEHVLVSFRRRRPDHLSSRKDTLPGTGFLDELGKARLLTHLESRNDNVLRILKDPSSRTDLRRNRSIYQLANIICTYQLLKMLSYASGNMTFRNACQTVLDLVEGISAVPTEVLRSMSLAMVQELSGFGHLLSRYIDHDLSNTDYEHLKAVMLCMAELLDCLASSVPTAHDAARKMTTYVSRIEERVRTRPTPTITMAQPHPSTNVPGAYSNFRAELNPFEDVSWLELFSEGFENPMLDLSFPTASAT